MITKFSFLSVALLLLTINDVSSQTENTKGSKASMYFTLGTDFLKDLEVNSILSAAGMPGFGKVAYGTSIGINLNTGGGGMINIEGGLRSSLNKNKGGMSSFIRYVPASVSYYFQAFKPTETSGFFLGCGYQIAAMNAEVFTKHTEADLNNLSTNDLQGALNLNSFSHGFEFSVLLFSPEEVSWWNNTNLKLSYLLDLSKPEWDSSSVNLTDSLSENFSRFQISLIRVFRRWN